MRLPLVAALLALLLAACTPRVIPAGPAIGPPALADDALVMADGARLPLHAWLPEGAPRAVILAVHGFNDYSVNYMQETAKLLTPAGLAIYAYDQRGFGAAPHRGIWAGAETLAADLAEAARLVKARHPGLPLYVLAESMGAAVTVLAATGAEPPPVAGYILTAPAFWGTAQMPGIMRWGVWLAARTVPIVGFPASAGGIVPSNNDSALRRWARDPLTLKVSRADAAEGLVLLMQQAVAALPRCCQGADGPVPTLVLVGAKDEVVPHFALRPALRALPPGPQHRIAIYPEGWHMLLRDEDAPLVARDVLAFITDPAAPLPSGAEASAQDWLQQQ